MDSFPLLGVTAFRLLLGAWIAVGLVKRAAPPVSSQVLMIVLGIVWAVWAVVLWWTTTTGRSGSEVHSLAYGLLLLLGASLDYGRGRSFRPLVAGWLLALVFAILVGLGQEMFGLEWENGSTLTFETGMMSVFNNPNLFAFVLLNAAPLMLVARASSTSVAWRTAYGAAFISTLVFTPLTYSWIGMGCLVVVAWIMGRRWTRTLLLGLGMIVAWLVLQSATRWLAWSPETMSWTTRVSLCQVGLEFGRASGWVGFGPGSFEVNMIQSGRMWETSGMINPHCGMGEVVSQYGALVLILLITLMARALRIGWQASRVADVGVQTVGRAIVASVAVWPLATTMTSAYLDPIPTWAMLSTLLVLATYAEQITRHGDQCSDAFQADSTRSPGMGLPTAQRARQRGGGSRVGIPRGDSESPIVGGAVLLPPGGPLSQSPRLP
jgi:hypothetical protein